MNSRKSKSDLKPVIKLIALLALFAVIVTAIVFFLANSEQTILVGGVPYHKTEKRWNLVHIDEQKELKLAAVGYGTKWPYLKLKLYTSDRFPCNGYIAVGINRPIYSQYVVCYEK